MARKTHTYGSKLPKRKSVVTAPRHTKRIGRNEPCPCGSGKKYKDCHRAEGAEFLDKIARQEDKQRSQEERRRLKEQGVPWYRRIFLR